MKSKNLIVGLVSLLVLSVIFTITTKSQKTEETPLYEPILIGTGGSPHWSPDGSKLAYMYKGSLYIANADGTGERLKVAELPKWTLGFIWADSTEFIFHESERHRIKGKGKEERRSIKRLTIDGEIKPIVEAQIHKGNPMITPPMVLDDGTVGYYEIPNLQGKIMDAEKTFKIIRSGKLKPNSALKQWTVDFFQGGPGTEIHLRTIDGSQEKKVPNPKGYDCLQLSPDGSKILANDIQGPQYGIWALDLDGRPVVKLAGSADVQDRVELGPGIYGWADGTLAKWSPDSKQIVYMVSAQNEVTVIATDLFIINADGTGRIRLTNTPDVIEAYPIWSPDGSRIAYVTDITSKIYVMRVK